MHPEITRGLAAHRQAELAQDMSSARTADAARRLAGPHRRRARLGWRTAARRVAAAFWLGGAPVKNTPCPVR